MGRTPIATANFRFDQVAIAKGKGGVCESAAARARRIAELNAGIRQKQFVRFLEQHRIEDAIIPGIGQGRKTLRRCYDVEDASDIEMQRINIKGFGPSLKSALIAWRMTIEQRSVFDPNAGIDPADMRVLDHELAQKQATLSASLSTGSWQLGQILLPWQIQRATNLGDLVRGLAQAGVNMKALVRF